MEDAWQAFGLSVLFLIAAIFGIHLTLRGFFYRRPDWSQFRWKFWQPKTGEDKKKFYTALVLQLLAVVFFGILAFIYIRYLKGISEL